MHKFTRAIINIIIINFAIKGNRQHHIIIQYRSSSSSSINQLSSPQHTAQEMLNTRQHLDLPPRAPTAHTGAAAGPAGQARSPGSPSRTQSSGSPAHVDDDDYSEDDDFIWLQLVDNNMMMMVNDDSNHATI
jgi:hypothetical protein